jgi:hypothetical protein
MKGSSHTAPASAGAVAGTSDNESDTKVSATVRRAGGGG